MPKTSQAVTTVLKKSAQVRGSCVVVRHETQGEDGRQTHEYQIALATISSLVLKTIEEYGNFPFDVPHSHKIRENGSVVFERPLSEWVEHEAQSDHLRSDKVAQNTCLSCSGSFYCFGPREYCQVCGIGVEKEARKHALALIRRAHGLSSSTDWQATGEDMNALMKAWKDRCRYLPMDERDPLWERFQAARQPFFDRRKEHYAERQRAWRERTQAAMIKQKDFVERIQAGIQRDRGNIQRWNDTIRTLRPGGRAQEIESSMRDKIRSVEGTIASKQAKVSEARAQIADMKARLAS